MSRVIRTLAPLLVLLAGGLLVWLIMANRPEPERRTVRESPVSVEVSPLQRRPYTIRLHSRGVIRPHRETTLVAQVAGMVSEVSSRFEVGNHLEKGAWLVRIDPRDYRIAVTLAESQLAQAQLRLAQEQARAEQARRDWERLGERGEPGELALRLPQLRSERAAVAAAEAQLAKARLDLERSQLAFLPEEEKPPVQLSWETGAGVARWEAHIVRTEGVVDPRTQQRFVVARLAQTGKSGQLRLRGGRGGNAPPAGADGGLERRNPHRRPCRSRDG